MASAACRPLTRARCRATSSGRPDFSRCQGAVGCCPCQARLADPVQQCCGRVIDQGAHRARFPVLPARHLGLADQRGRLLARECELFGQAANTQAHQVRKLSDLSQQGQEQPAWAALMAKMRRKTLMVCPDCHDGIHKGG